MRQFGYAVAFLIFSFNSELHLAEDIPGHLVNFLKGKHVLMPIP
jgi:hypothetical protein